jgi:hypothetical protein
MAYEERENLKMGLLPPRPGLLGIYSVFRSLL